MSGVEQDDSRKKREAWEDELWSYISVGNGIECPLLDSCELKHNQYIKCFSNEEEKLNTEEIYRFNDKVDIDFSGSPKFNQRRVCLQKSRISQLVTELATKYRNQAWNTILPVPDNLIIEDRDNHPIVVRYVPLQANHGAVWKLDDCWIIHLNKHDIPAKQRFTLYHEIFHILAHSEGNCTFKKSMDPVIYFNEVLADHFSANILIPHELARQKWAESQDINSVANIFGVPKPVMFLALRNLGSI